MALKKEDAAMIGMLLDDFRHGEGEPLVETIARVVSELRRLHKENTQLKYGKYTDYEIAMMHTGSTSPETNLKFMETQKRSMSKED